MTDPHDPWVPVDVPDLPELTVHLRARPGPLASSALKARILADFDRTQTQPLHQVLWTFGAVWRPAAGLIVAAVFGVYFGLNVDQGATQLVGADTLFAEEIVILGQSDSIGMGITALEDF